MINEAPAISVIIPMYNTEKYIGECLISLLTQSFKNFELIIVDNCSTDKGVEIVKSYAPKFSGRLNLINTEKNIGSPSLPRNMGLEISRGKYVYFMDSDDVILPDALENLFTSAEKNCADLLYCKKFLYSYGVGQNFLKEAKLNGDLNDNNFEQVTDDLEIRIKFWIQSPNISMAPWAKFVKRDLLIKNNVQFFNMATQQDSIWSFELFVLAKKIIMVPYICYIYRQRPDSIFNLNNGTELNPISIYKKFDRIMKALKHVDDFMGNIEFFQKNPLYRYAVINYITNQNINWISNSYPNSSPSSIYENLKKAFADEMGNFDVLISYLVSYVIALSRSYNALAQKFEEIQKPVAAAKGSKKKKKK